ncbi:hypothetical protein [Isoptericola jiangsuensis]|uniref:hypothetical protein n=1 Tax=Isoptericola jiangsuensis TaxID=548579 RepID=UPI001145DCEF|nr:hypothetical protein [Isoptericola jiangsuensis]
MLPQPSGPATRLPLRLVGAHEPGYWRADAELPVGTDYAFSVDGRAPVPDPCSTSLPAGIHGPSRVLDEDFTWTDDAWTGAHLSRGVLLHLDVTRATPQGDLDAAAALLPEAAALGVDAVELAPVAQFDPALGPAAGVRLFAVHAPYGGPAALQRFVDTAHGAGLAVVLDLPHRWAVADGLGLHAFGPYANGARIGARAGSPTDADTPRVNLDGSGSRGPRDFLVADARRWLTTFHVDGLLLDLDVLVDRSAAPFLGELAEAVQATGAETGRHGALLTDGRGMSDRLTTLVRGLLDGRLSDPSGLLKQLSADVANVGAPPRDAPVGLRRAYRATQRSGPVLVGELSRLPAAARALPWAVDTDPDRDPDPDGDERAIMLAVVLLAGTAVVLDTEHVPLGCPEPTSRRLRAWTRTLLTLRSAVLDDVDVDVEVTAEDDVVVVRRGRSALLLTLAPGEHRVDLGRRLATSSTTWRVAAAWDQERTEVLAGRLHVPGRSAVVLREDPTDVL